ncbi:hypothetical protein [Pseudomonas mangiferae]|uniref:Uncharacterized protein n=1 Tax=Pseudomonas mangiferae TaxID=2593654 RepID=A0A553H4Z7_9PSED|nr:hypothetical protein [Pseudomonas mangiferae]TRX76839.1 hypothetical protein FM069_02130 [Pseudomonas mangiferae]
MQTAAQFAATLIETNFDSAEIQALFKASELPKEEFLQKLGSQLVEHNGTLVNGQASAKGLFPLHKVINFEVVEFDITVTNPSNGRYIVEVVSKIMGYKVGDSFLSFDNGTLSRHETVGNSTLGAEYDVKLQLSGGFNVSFEASVWIDIGFLSKKAHFGPKWLF